MTTITGTHRAKFCDVGWGVDPGWGVDEPGWECSDTD